MIANRTEFLEAIIRKLCSQVEISAAWEASSGRKFPANISGHDTHGGEDLTPEEYEALTAIMNERTVPTDIDELGARAARLVADMLQQAGRYLTHGYGEINEVLIEARKRGWLEPIE